MANLYLPIYNKQFKNNNIYNMQYDKEALNKFLDDIKFLYQDKHISKNSENDLIEYSINPFLYTILMDMTCSDVVDLRSLGVYMWVNFNERIGNKDEISDLVYDFELQQVANSLTINEKSMLKSNFNNTMLQFFELFDIEIVKLKRNYMDYIMNDKHEIAFINENILLHTSLQKVYKKFF